MDIDKLSRLSGHEYNHVIFPIFTKVFNTISENLSVPKMAKHWSYESELLYSQSADLMG